jgi:hypothetical protein
MIRLDIDNLPDGIASRMLAQSGIAAIWKLHVAAAIVYRTGNLPAAASIMDLADAATVGLDSSIRHGRTCLSVRMTQPKSFP